MSLRSYLFALVGSLIVLLTITQLFLVYWIEQNLAQEVEVKARHLSEQAIDMAFQKIDDKGLDKNSFNHRVIHKQSNFDEKVIEEHIEVFALPTIKNTENNKIGNKNIANKTFTEYEQVKDNTMDISVHFEHQEKLEGVASDNDTAAHIDNIVLKKELKTLINTIHDQQIKIFASDDSQAFVFKSPKMVSHQWVEKHQIKSKTQNLIDYIKAILIICCIVALVFAFWLSIQFNKPLIQLSNGFKKLALGDYQHQVPEQGVKEIRATISHFNHMVSRLDELTQAEQQHSEIAHLAELGEVSRGLAHSLRNPIHTIGLSIEQLSENSLSSDKRSTLLKTVQNKISHIDKNIKSLLTLTTTGINRDENVPILAVVQDIILEYKLCQEQAITFKVGIEPTIRIHGAESEIRSILHTLIINAAEACLTDGIVDINAQVIDKITLEIRIIDNGSGIDKDINDTLFQPHISTKPEGAGMGLYIAKRIISLHYQGNINLTNNISENGCTATATFITK